MARVYRCSSSPPLPPSSFLHLLLPWLSPLTLGPNSLSLSLSSSSLLPPNRLISCLSPPDRLYKCRVRASVESGVAPSERLCACRSLLVALAAFAAVNGLLVPVTQCGIRTLAPSHSTATAACLRPTRVPVTQGSSRRAIVCAAGKESSTETG